MGEHEVETCRARRLDVEVVRRPVAGHLRVPVGDVLVDMLTDGPERVGSRIFGEPVVPRHRPQVRDTLQTEQHHRPPLLDRDRAVGVDLFELHHDLGACPSRPHRGEPCRRIQTLTGNERSVHHDVVFPVHTAADVLPHAFRHVGPGSLLRGEDQDHRKHGRYGAPVQHRRGVIPGRRGVGRDGLGCQAARERAVPGRVQHELAHPP